MRTRLLSPAIWALNITAPQFMFDSENLSDEGMLTQRTPNNVAVAKPRVYGDAALQRYARPGCG